MRIGAGVYAGSFSYGSASDDVIQGSGADTVIQGVGELPALSVSGSGAPTVTGLAIRMATVPIGFGGVGLRIGPGKADGVRVENPRGSRARSVPGSRLRGGCEREAGGHPTPRSSLLSRLRRAARPRARSRIQACQARTPQSVMSSRGGHDEPDVGARSLVSPDAVLARTPAE